VRTLVPSLDDAAARSLLERAGGNVKRAVVMARCGVDFETAISLLDGERGFLRPLIEKAAGP
jgi:N-acetylmuramic acid 6-phosphate (MurNAc-6-P) etherase